jgi:hypothetical protein
VLAIGIDLVEGGLGLIALAESGLSVVVGLAGVFDVVDAGGVVEVPLGVVHGS